MRALRQLLDSYSSNTMKDGPPPRATPFRVYAVQPGPTGERIYETQPPEDEQRAAFYLYPQRERNALVNLVVNLEAASQQVRALVTSAVRPYVRFGARSDRARYTELRLSLKWFCHDCDVFGGTTDPKVGDETRSAFSPHQPGSCPFLIMLERLAIIITVIRASFDWAMDLPDNTQLPTEPASSGTLYSAYKAIRNAYIDAVNILEDKVTTIKAHIELHNQGRWVAAPAGLPRLPQPASPSVCNKRAKA